MVSNGVFVGQLLDLKQWLSNLSLHQAPGVLLQQYSCVSLKEFELGIQESLILKTSWVCFHEDEVSNQCLHPSIHRVAEAFCVSGPVPGFQERHSPCLQASCWEDGQQCPLWTSLSQAPYVLDLKKKNFIYLFLGGLGLCCCSGFSLVLESGGYSLVVVHRLLTVVAPVLEHQLRRTGFSNWLKGSRAQAK